MEAKKKAIELVRLMFVKISVFTDNNRNELAKQCALICVDEIIEDRNYQMDDLDRLNYWQEVKSEIEKL